MRRLRKSAVVRKSRFISCVRPQVHMTACLFFLTCLYVEYTNKNLVNERVTTFLTDTSSWNSDSSCARQRARSSTFIVSESLFPIRSHGEYYLKVPLRVLVESTSRVDPCQISSGLSKSQLANTKVSRTIVRLKRVRYQTWDSDCGTIPLRPLSSVEDSLSLYIL